MATTAMGPAQQERPVTPLPASQASVETPIVDASAAVAKAASIVSNAQAPAGQSVATALDIQDWIAEFGQRSCASAGEVCLWLLAMVAFLAITTIGIWWSTAHALVAH